MKFTSGYFTRLLIAIAFVSFFLSYTQAQSKKERIDELVTRYIDIGKFNGAVLVSEDGKIIYEEANGNANPATGEMLTTAHRFRLASVTKNFTGTAIMILEEQGKLQKTDDIRKYLPELPYKNITVAHLLTHTSGLPDYGVLLDKYWDTLHIDSPERKLATNYDMYDYLVKYKPLIEFLPGEKESYSNTGFNLLAMIIENASGLTYPDFMKKFIFDAAGMNNTFVNDTSGYLPDKNRARGLKIKPGTLDFEVNDHHYQNGVYGDGGIYSTIHDLYLYDQALRNGTIVKKSTLEKAYVPFKLNDGQAVDYNYGWSIIDTDEGLVVAHGGSWVGFRTFFLRDIEHNHAVIQLCNSPAAPRGDLAFKIRDILYGKEIELPKYNIGETMLRELDKNNNLNDAIKLYYIKKAQETNKYDFGEAQLNWFGYQLMAREKIEDAVKIFKMNVEMFPGAYNVYDSLGEAYMKFGDNELAIKNYSKSLELNPNNENAKRMLKKLEN